MTGGLACFLDRAGRRPYIVLVRASRFGGSHLVQECFVSSPPETDGPSERETSERAVAVFMTHHTIKVTTESGSTDVECYWKNDVLAVTRDIGHLTRSGVDVAPIENGWTITHIQSGRSMGPSGWVNTNPEIMRALAEHIAPVIPWGTLSLQQLLSNKAHRNAVEESARAFWASREREGA